MIYIYQGLDPFILSWILDLDPFIFVTDTGSRIWILLFYRGFGVPYPGLILIIR
jgi:hypothetical protein